MLPKEDKPMKYVSPELKFQKWAVSSLLTESDPYNDPSKDNLEDPTNDPNFW